ncbi:MAG: hypothetical protein Q9218_007534 [Villophora microphyllina]
MLMMSSQIRTEERVEKVIRALRRQGSAVSTSTTTSSQFSAEPSWNEFGRALENEGIALQMALDGYETLKQMLRLGNVHSHGEPAEVQVSSEDPEYFWANVPKPGDPISLTALLVSLLEVPETERPSADRMSNPEVDERCLTPLLPETPTYSLYPPPTSLLLGEPTCINCSSTLTPLLTEEPMHSPFPSPHFSSDFDDLSQAFDDKVAFGVDYRSGMTYPNRPLSAIIEEDHRN